MRSQALALGRVETSLCHRVQPLGGDPNSKIARGISANGSGPQETPRLNTDHQPKTQNNGSNSRLFSRLLI
jgi:hypothetical protein